MRFRLILTILFSAVLVFLFAGLAAASTYTVAPGDSLYKIGQRFGVSATAIQSANGLGNATMIRPGQKLVIPSSGNVYTVKSGDSLFTIARNHGLTVNDIQRANGIAGSAITPGQQLRIPSGSAAVTTNRGFRVTARDFDALARLVTSEADCQIHEVKVAVAAVVLNRVQSPLFPNNIWDVVYDRSGGKVQFEPVLNGWINRPATPAAVRAAQEALNGWDPSWGATFFFEPWVTNKFLHSLPVARKLGAFTFAYSG